MTQAAELTAAQQKRAQLLEQVWTRLEAGDSFAVAEYIESQGTRLEVAEIYSNLLQDLCWKKQDLPRMILVGRAGIAYCLRQARLAAKNKATKDEAAKLKGIAKTIAYNLSSNTWPAWEDEGIVVTHSDQMFGLDAALLNLRLAGELNRSADKVANAHWLLGAHYLALEQQQTAVKQFNLAVDKFAESNQPDFEQMARGYVAIARLTADKTDSAADKQLDEAIAALKKLGTDDANFFADQLKSVNKFFAR